MGEVHGLHGGTRAAGSLVTVHADSADDVDERDEDDNLLIRACPV